MKTITVLLMLLNLIFASVAFSNEEVDEWAFLDSDTLDEELDMLASSTPEMDAKELEALLAREPELSNEEWWDIYEMDEPMDDLYRGEDDGDYEEKLRHYSDSQTNAEADSEEKEIDVVAEAESNGDDWESVEAEEEVDNPKDIRAEGEENKLGDQASLDSQGTLQASLLTGQPEITCQTKGAYVGAHLVWPFEASSNTSLPPEANSQTNEKIESCRRKRVILFTF